MTEKYISLKDVAVECGVKPFQISYAISNGFLKEPSQRITNRRMFTQADVKAAKEHFSNWKKAEPKKKGGAK